MSEPSDPRAGSATLPVILLALVPFGLGYFLSYLFRAVNAVVAPDLVREIGLSPDELGLLTAAYLGAFAAFQLPLGVLLDRYGPRRVQAVLLSLAGLGAILFGLGRDFWTLALARTLIGIGVAGGLMAGFKSVVIWVAPARRALANSCVMSLGAVGLLVSTQPMQMLADAIGWRSAFIGLAAATLAVALSILLLVPERRTEAAPEPLAHQIRQIGTIFADRGFLTLAPLLSLTAGTHIAIQTLWAAPWLRDIGGLDRGGVAGVLLVMAAAFFVGILVTGAIADWLGRYGISELTVMTGFLVLFLIAQALIILEVKPLIAVWSVFGMTGQVAILAYPWLSSHFGARLSGRANTAMNLLIFLAAFLIQYAIGVVISHYPVAADGRYDPQSYRIAFGLLLALELAALAWFVASMRRLGPGLG